MMTKSITKFEITVITPQEKTVFFSIQYKNGCLTASDLFHMFTQSTKFYTFHYNVLESTYV